VFGIQTPIACFTPATATPCSVLGMSIVKPRIVLVPSVVHTSAQFPAPVQTTETSPVVVSSVTDHVAKPVTAISRAWMCAT
jgi:hypothetical protein